VRALAHLLHSLESTGRAGRLRIVAAYAASRTLLPAVERRMRRVERRRRRSRARRPWVESTVYTRSVGVGRGSRRRDVPPERIERALAEHDAALAAGDARVRKRGRRSRVTAHGDLVVKERVAPTPLARLRDRLSPRRAAAGYVHAHALGVLGVPTAGPVAFVRREGRTFSLFEDLSRFPRLDLHAAEVFRRAALPERRALLRASADWVARLHARGIYHGDWKGVNVRVDPGPPPRFHLIDTDRVVVSDGPVPLRRRVKNLAQLAASIPRAVTRTDRLRWWRRYRSHPGLDADERVVARRVSAALARRTVVVDEPIE
jgi:hypothetical protein